MDVAGTALTDNMNALGPKVLPYSEQLKVRKNGREQDSSASKKGQTVEKSGWKNEATRTLLGPKFCPTQNNSK